MNQLLQSNKPYSISKSSLRGVSLGNCLSTNKKAMIKITSPFYMNTCMLHTQLIYIYLSYLNNEKISLFKQTWATCFFFVFCFFFLHFFFTFAFTSWFKEKYVSPPDSKKGYDLQPFSVPLKLDKAKHSRTSFETVIYLQSTQSWNYVHNQQQN